MITVIKPKIKEIEKVLVKQKYDLNKKYIDSPYLIKIEDYNDLIIENILTGEIIGQSLPLEKKDDIYLIENWFKILPEQKPYELYKNIQLQANTSRNNLNNYNLLENFSNLVIFTTLGCNANCSYCYEQGERDNKIKMTPEVADKIIDLIEKTNKKKIYLSWFGGEPLYNANIITYICSKLKEKNVEYSSSMITNGLLFNSEMIKEAKKLWKMTHLQITIDGTEYEYEKIKQVPPGSFNSLIKNIEELLQQNIKVNIRLNLSQTNLKDLKKVVKFLYQHFKQYSSNLFHIETHELFGEEREKNVYKNLLDLQLYVESLFNNIHFSRYEWKDCCCMADRGETLTILPLGDISVCEHNLTHDFVTNLDKTYYNIDILNSYAGYQDREDCQSCPIRPGCIYNVRCPANGGCNCSPQRVKYILYIKKRRLANIAKQKRKRRRHLMITRNLYTNLDIYDKAVALMEAFNIKEGESLNYPVKINFYLQKNMNAQD